MAWRTRLAARRFPAALAGRRCWPAGGRPPAPPAPPAFQCSSRSSQPRVERLVDGVAGEREREDDDHDAETRRDEVPPGPAADRAGGERGVEHCSPRDLDRIAETEERQRRFG